jgi:hypothetical protein
MRNRSFLYSVGIIANLLCYSFYTNTLPWWVYFISASLTVICIENIINDWD